MALTEICNTSFFLSLAIILLSVGVIFIYVNYRMSQQDHKISSMLGLISTMAQELEYFRNKLSITNPNSNQNQNSNVNTLIQVSDDEDDEDEDDDDDDDDDDEDDEDDDDEEEEEEEEEKPDKDVTNKLFHIKVENKDEKEKNSIVLVDFTNLDIGETNDDDVSDDESESVSSHNTKYIHINPDDQIINLNNLSNTNTNININNSYKNLSVQKLRNIVVEKGLSNDPSKLKKNDILKMLSLE
jgi:hypothetical protein